MSAQLAYATVILVWSTTPLAIKIGNDSLTPMAALSLRTLLATALALSVCVLVRRASFWRREHWPVYGAAAIGIFPNMPLVYSAAEYIPSGLIAIMFGISPFLTGVMAWMWLGEDALRGRKLAGLALAMSGLLLVFYNQLSLDGEAWIGMLLMLASTFLFSLSSVLVKKLAHKTTVSAADQMLGSMLVALPGLLLCWWLVDGNLTVEFSRSSLLSVLYLALLGSLLGMVTYFHILKTLPVATVSLIPLITPVLAVILGAWLAGEQVPAATAMGGLLILLALAIYQGNLTVLWRRFRRLPRQAAEPKPLTPGRSSI
ncbi:DMT family transporter [Pseudomaricurvus alkylphenolicus]|uniref:DMT family transporter n=1 Tax=Pseudomaricurvus alkylphenolicus TaxID=1306991 RepID=UPI00142127C4|nr:DMT family transporter [Pseudomaricurvus alkylphenolicus]NIB43222.1 DMT family transporter [Pseudomaricurvus alkylphenolicus]